MKDMFVTRLLKQDADGQIIFTDTKINLLPGDGIVSDQDDSIVLAGGFPSVAPQSSFLVSPTLQLNADLTTISEPELEKIAHAELVREQEKMFRSYTVDVDTRIAAVASSPEVLREFCDTFGGILAIEPFLTKGYDAEFTTVIEMTVDSGKAQGVSLEYAVRAPLDSKKCTYCGTCGTVCPERAISKDLDFNFELCSYCKKCEENCPTEAIHIYELEYRTLKVRALIVLDNVDVQGLEEADHVYGIDQFEDYLKTLYPFQIDEIISVNDKICHYNAGLERGCTLCYDSCPYGAISLEGGVHINPLKCEECGECVAVCPTGALIYERFTDERFVKYMDACPSVEDKTVVISDTESLHDYWWFNRGHRFDRTFFFSCERTEFLSFFHLVYLFAKGASRILVTKQAGMGRVLERNIKLANTVLASLFDGVRPIVMADGLDAELLEKNEKSILDPKQASFDWKNRREAQNLILAHLAGQSDQNPGFKGNHQTPFATITCNSEACTQCMSCVSACRIRAMRADETEMIVSHIGASCIGCGLCVSVCPEKALEMERHWQFTPEFFGEETMAQGEPMYCARCGKVFGTKKSYDRVMNILSTKENVDTSHFTYCEDCRVVRLFEDHVGIKANKVDLKGK